MNEASSVTLVERRRHMHRTIRLLVIGVLGLTALGHELQAESYPARPVTLIVPFPAGGSTDVALRSLASATEKHLGQSIVIENRAGANGVLAVMQMAASASPDGYTISQMTRQALRYPYMVKTSFDPTKDVTPIIGVTSYVFGLVVRADAPWNTFDEFLRAASGPRKLNYGTTGAGSSQHIIIEQIGQSRGVTLTHLAFKGDAEMLNSLLGGHIDAVAGSTSWAPLVNEGKFRLLVTFGARRTKSWPEVPTLRDVGIDMEMSAPFGLVGPKGMTPETVKTLHDAFTRGMQEPRFLATLEKLDQEIWYLNSEDFRSYILREAPEQKRIVEEFGLKQY